MKHIIEKVIRLRNPAFKFDEEVGTSLLLALILEKLGEWLRGLRVLLSLRQPKMLFLGTGVSFFHMRNIRWGKWVRLQKGVHLSGMGKGILSIGHNSSIGAYSRLIVSTSFNNLGEHITIGNNVGIGEFACLGGGGGLEIGDECIVGAYLSCHPENHIFQDPDTPIRHQGTTRKGIKIGRNCWIGAKVTILDGVTIGDNCVLAAGAVINTDIPANSVAGGVPARVIKTIDKPHQQGQHKAAYKNTQSAMVELEI